MHTNHQDSRPHQTRQSHTQPFLLLIRRCCAAFVLLLSACLATGASVAPPTFSSGRGWYVAPMNITLSTTTAGAGIRYTTDGSTPTATSGTLYSGPVPITGTTVLRAVGYMQNGSMDPSAVLTHTYIYLADVTQQEQMDGRIINDPTWGSTIHNDLVSVPTVSVVMNQNDLFGSPQDGVLGIYRYSGCPGPNCNYGELDEDPNWSDYRNFPEVFWERPCSMEYIVPNATGTFQVNCGIRIQGGYSRVATSKHSFRFVFKNEYGPATLDADIFPDSTIDEFNGLSLHAFFNDHWVWNGYGGNNGGNAQFIRDQWCRDTHTAMGGYGTHGRYVHLYLNGIYWGLHNLGERADNVFAANYLGGQSTEYDVLKTPPGDEGDPEVIDGNTTAFNAMMAVVENIRTGVIPANQAMSAMSQHLDITDFVDYMLINFYGANWDWPGNNWTLMRRRTADGLFHFIVNDAEYTFGVPPPFFLSVPFQGINDDRTFIGDGSQPTGFFNGRPASIYNELRKDPEFRRLFGDRVHRHMFNSGALTPSRVESRWMQRVTEMQQSVIPESARWGDIAGTLFTPANWQAELTRLRSATTSGTYKEQGWFQNRTAIFLGHLRSRGLYPPAGAGREAPTFSPFGGRVAANTQLTLNNPNAGGTLYYTTDGTDPRAFGGAVASSAQTYTSPLTINGYVLLKARVRNASGEWSALVEAPFNVHQSALAITEIMYHPPVYNGHDSDDLEYLEVRNTGGVPIDLSGLHFVAGIEFQFRNGTYLEPNGSAVLIRDQEAFADKYAALFPSLRPYGVFKGKLANSGETLSLADGVGAFLNVSYPDGGDPDGGNYSLELASLASGAWRVSPANGTPGVPEPMVWISATDNTATEAAGNNGTFTIRRTGSTDDALTVNLSISGTALNGTDYNTLPTTVNIPIGANSVTVDVVPINDTAPEDLETVTLTISTAATYLVGVTNAASVNIVDNDPPTVTVALTDGEAWEPGDNVGTLTFSRNGAITANLAVNYTIGGTAINGTDYFPLSGSITIPSGLATATLTIVPKGDVQVESLETVNITLAAGNYIIGNAGTLTVTIEDGPVALWRGDGNANDSIGSNHGTAIGAGYVTGVRGQAFKFDGYDDYVRIVHDSSLQFGDELSIEMWFKRANNLSTGGLIDKRNWTTCNYGVILTDQLYLYYNDPNVAGTAFETVATSLPTAGVFHHFVGTYKQVTSTTVQMKIYLDGQLIQTATVQGTLVNTFNSDPLSIGTPRDGLGGSFFHGVTDEVALYKRTLSASQVLARYQAVTVPPWWNFDSDGDGLYDDQEAAYGTDPFRSDTDNDGLSDFLEVFTYGTDPTNPDTDGDWMPDGFEIATFGWGANDASNGAADPDGDGVSNSWEYYMGTDLFNGDSDGDGVGDGTELSYGLNPLSPDTDGDNIPDGAEWNYGTNPASYDSDGDGISDYDELFVWYSNPNSADSDSDYLPDGYELLYWGNPVSSAVGWDDDDFDGAPNSNEAAFGTNPLDPLSFP